MSKVKICGLKTIEDIEIANEILPDYIGFVFAKSKRYIDPDKALILKQHLNNKILSVGVFVNETIENILDIVNRGIIDVIQLHGDEDHSYIQKLRSLCNCDVIKAVGISHHAPITAPHNVHYVLFDTASLDRGGTGQKFDWNLLKSYNSLPYFVAGGLTCDNVCQCINLLHPFCVDISSGVETDGKKDSHKMRKFVEIVRRI